MGLFPSSALIQKPQSPQRGPGLGFSGSPVGRFPSGSHPSPPPVAPEADEASPAAQPALASCSVCSRRTPSGPSRVQSLLSPRHHRRKIPPLSSPRPAPRASGAVARGWGGRWRFSPSACSLPLRGDRRSIHVLFGSVLINYQIFEIFLDIASLLTAISIAVREYAPCDFN